MQVDLQLLIDSIKDYAVFLLDAQGNVASWNPGAQRIKQYLPAEIIGRHFSVFYLREEVEAGKCEHELEVAARVGRFEDEGWRVRKDGTRFWANVVISAVRDAQDQLVGFSKVTRDLTERRRNEAERAARLAAEQANQAKDEFLAVLGHELRNPLAPISTALQLVRMRDRERAPAELDVIERQVAHLSRLVDDLLDVARLASGKISLSQKPIELIVLVRRALEICEPLLEERRHRVELDIAERDLVVDADELRMVQVLSNLLTNAAKYTDPGGNIRINAARIRGEIVLRVKDDGMGMLPELVPRVFEMFVQGGRTVDRAEGGLGLGLALCRSLVEQHGGHIAAYSEGPGRGSEFVVRLPPSIIEPQNATPRIGLPKVEAVPRRSVLVVDDNVDGAEMLGEILRMVELDVTVVHDGVQALAAVANEIPDVAVLDIGLPVMDGYELATRLRAECAPKVPYLIALTGYGQERDRARAEKAGFDEHMVKPVDATELMRVIRTAGLRR